MKARSREYVYELAWGPCARVLVSCRYVLHIQFWAKLKSETKAMMMMK